MAVHFGDVTFDDARRMLLRGSEPLHVSPKAFQLLGILIGRRPTAVSKADLQDELWLKIVEEREHAIRLDTEPLFDPLREDPRFQLLLRRAGFARS